MRPSGIDIKFHLIEQPMKSSKDGYFEAPCSGAVAFATVVALTVTACASAPSAKMESRYMANQLDLPNCRVSVPLSEAKVVESAKMDGNPEPEQNHEWIKINANLQPGDTLRLVKCKGSSDPYFYALFRENRIILRFHSMLFD